MRPTLSGYTIPQLLGGVSLFSVGFMLEDILKLHLIGFSVAALLAGVAVARLAEPPLGKRLRECDVQAPWLFLLTIGALMVSASLISTLPPLSVLLNVSFGLLLVGDGPDRWLRRRTLDFWKSLRRSVAKPVMPG